jgi:hypothetical protein
MVPRESFKEPQEEMKLLNKSSMRSPPDPLFTFPCPSPAPQVAENLAIFCINICRLVDPEVIIFGGGMAHAGDTLLKSVHESMMKHTWTVYPSTIRLEIAHQVGNAGVIGAALSGESLYFHLHPKASHHGEPSNPPDRAATAAPPGGGLVGRDVAMFSAIAASGLALLHFTNSARGSTPQLTTNTRNFLLLSHAVLVGVHLFGMLRHRRGAE